MKTIENIEELKARKAQLERDMASSLRHLLDGFHLETGESVATISISMREAMFIDATNTIWVLVGVKCTIDANDVA